MYILGESYCLVDSDLVVPNLTHFGWSVPFTLCFASSTPKPQFEFKDAAGLLNLK